MQNFLRPKATVLPDSAIVPDENLIRPPPSRFTHEVIKDQPYFYSLPKQNAAPDGQFAAGTQVLLISHDGGTLCHVADGRGLYVVTEYDGLRPIEIAP